MKHPDKIRKQFGYLDREENLNIIKVLIAIIASFIKVPVTGKSWKTMKFFTSFFLLMF